MTNPYSGGNSVTDSLRVPDNLIKESSATSTGKSPATSTAAFKASGQPSTGHPVVECISREQVPSQQRPGAIPISGSGSGVRL